MASVYLQYQILGMLRQENHKSETRQAIEQDFFRKKEEREEGRKERREEKEKEISLSW